MVLVASFAFKFQRSGPLLQFVYNFSRYTKYPLKIYPKFIRVVLTFVIPLGLCLFYPFENLFAPVYNPWFLALVIFGFTALFCAICIFVWDKFIRLYESTGS